MADRTVFDIQGLDETLRMLQSLPAEVVSKRGGPVRASLRKGAIVIQKPIIDNLKRSNDPGFSIELLEKNIIVSRGKAPSDGKGERYLVRVKRKTYPDRNGRPVTTLQTAQLKEYGSDKQAPEPFIVPAFKAHAREAIDTSTRELGKAIERIVRKLWKGSR